MTDLSSNHLKSLYLEVNNDDLITFISSNCFFMLGYSEKELLNKNVGNYFLIPPYFKYNESFKTKSLSKKGVLNDINLLIRPIKDSKNELVGKKISAIEIPSSIDVKENFFCDLFQNSPDIIYRFELSPKFRFTYLSPSIENILGYTLKEYEDNPNIPIDITHPDDIEAMLSKFDVNSDFSKPRTIRHKHKNGHYVYLEDFSTPICDKAGNLIGLQGISRDVTRRKEIENNLKKMTYFDGLTGLFNKLYFEKQVHALNTKENTSVGVIFCDLDNLKCTNDSLGHNFGDDLIVQASETLKLISPPNSIISRIGGDEFVILLKNSSLEETKNIYSSLTNLIETQQDFSDNISIQMSLGYAFCDSSIENIRNTISLADKNMYANKSKKKV